MKIKYATLPFALASLFAGSVMAASFSITPPTTSLVQGSAAGTQVTFTFGYDNAGTNAYGIQADATWDTTQLTYVSHSAGCSHPNAGAVRVAQIDFGGTTWPSNPSLCTFVLQVNADNNGSAWADGDTALVQVTGAKLTGPSGDQSSQLTSPANATISVVAAPPDVVLGYSPASAVAFPGGTQGDVTTANIAVSVASGTVGTGTLNNCVITGPNAGAFSVTAPGSVTAPPAANLGLSVTLSNAALAATLTCDVADAGTPVSHTWSLTAPAGTPVPGPALTATPAAGSTATQSGLPGATLTYNFGLANSGFGSGAGTTLDYNCSVSGAGFTLASGATGSGIAVGASGTVVVTAVAPADGTSINGSLDCTSNAPGFATFSFPLVATGRAFVAPTFVPASSLWSKIALFGLLGALGMLTFGLRRNH